MLDQLPQEFLQVKTTVLHRFKEWLVTLNLVLDGGRIEGHELRGEEPSQVTSEGLSLGGVQLTRILRNDDVQEVDLLVRVSRKQQEDDEVLERCEALLA